MDTISVILHLTGLGVLLFLSAFFSGSETALFSLSKTQVERLRYGDSKSGAIAAGLLDNPRRLLITILVGNMFVNVASASLVAAFATDAAITLLGSKGVSAGAGVAIVFTTILLLIFGEITPKTIAVHNSEPISKLVSYPIYLFSKLIYPLRTVLRSLTNFLMQIVMGGSVPVEDRLTTEELKVMVDAAEEEGTIREQEKEMINTIFELRSITGAEIMVPRTEMVCISEERTLQHLFDLARTVGRSRIPVYSENIDHIFGIAYIKDFPIWRNYDIYQMTVGQFMQDSEKLWPGGKGTLIRQPFFVPETRTAIGLFQDFRDRGIQMAILLDEYGGTAGLVTMEDLVEELVGEIDDEYDVASEDFSPLDASTTLVSGGVSIRNVNRKLGLNLLAEEDEDIDTIGGYVLHLFGRVPKSGESLTVDDLQFEVAKVYRQRITQILIRKLGVS